MARIVILIHIPDRHGIGGIIDPAAIEAMFAGCSGC